MSARTSRALLEDDLLELHHRRAANKPRDGAESYLALLTVRRRLVEAHDLTHKPDVQGLTNIAISRVDSAVAAMERRI